MNQIVKKYLTEEIIQEIENTENKNVYNLSAKCSVYIHVVPKEINKYNHNKFYVGLTTASARIRWGSNGSGYNNQVFSKVIQKYGWDNIEHYVISDKLLIKEAQYYERLLIKHFNSNNYLYGYNLTNGGEIPYYMYKEKDIFQPYDCNIEKSDYSYNFKLGKKIAQYDLDGNLIQTYRTTIEALENVKTLNCSQAIRQCAKKENSQAGGFMWKYFVDVPECKIKPYIKKGNKRKVCQFDVFGNFIKEWESISEAKQKYGNSVSDACYRKQRFSHGYQWRFSDDVNDIEDISYLYEVKDNEINKILVGTFQLYLPLVQIDTKTGKIVNIFKNSDKASNKTGFNKKSIKSCCRGACYSYNNYCWKYLRDIDDIYLKNITDPILLNKLDEIINDDKNYDNFIKKLKENKKDGEI